jgi:hypothetical protein
MPPTIRTKVHASAVGHLYAPLALPRLGNSLCDLTNQLVQRGTRDHFDHGHELDAEYIHIGMRFLR